MAINLPDNLHTIRHTLLRVSVGELPQLKDVSLEDVCKELHGCGLNGLPSQVLTELGDGYPQHATGVLLGHGAADACCSHGALKCGEETC